MERVFELLWHNKFLRQVCGYHFLLESVQVVLSKGIFIMFNLLVRSPLSKETNLEWVLCDLLMILIY